jgi:1,2-diacylglycerol 3-alpha-glucosyltransferase
MPSKSILFINEGLGLGGIETYLVRISKKLHEQGNQLKFLFFSNSFDPELLKELKTYGDVYFFENYVLGPALFKKKPPLLKLLLPLKSQKLHNDVLENLTHIVATDYNSVLFAGKITPYNTSIKLLVGIYHINEFDFSTHHNWYFEKIAKKLMSSLPEQNLIIYNSAVQLHYSALYNKGFENNKIITLGIDVEKVQDYWVGKQNNRIVSIGRLTNWKRYNHSMIQVIQDFKKKGVFYTYDSYGDGESRQELEEMVEKAGLKDQIKYHHSIPYNEFTTVIKDSLMFIGAGTALIEASACGLPSLIGIENEIKTVSYGFLHDTTGSSYQEQQLNLSYKDISSFITDLSLCTTQEYDIECKKAKDRAQFFGMEKAIKGFTNYLNNSESFTFHLKYHQLIHVIASMLWNKITKPKNHYAKRL